MTEIALERIIKLDNVVHLFQVSYLLGAEKLRSYCMNFMLKEFDMISAKKEFVTMREDAFRFLVQYLPTKMKRQASSFASLKTEFSMVKMENEHLSKPKLPVMVLGESLQNKEKADKKPRIKRSKRICIKAKKEEAKIDKNFVVTGRSHCKTLASSKSMVFGVKDKLLRAGINISSRKFTNRL